MNDLDHFFNGIRRDIVGIDQVFRTPYGEQRIVYADWTASGRLYAPIERQLIEVFGPFVANTHSESNTTGTTMTHAYHEAHAIIKRHVNAGPDDVIITAGSGMTTVVNKLIRMLGLRLPEQLASFCELPRAARPVVFVTHMEHHSNHTTWIETIADVEVIAPDERGLVDCAATILKHNIGTPARPGNLGCSLKTRPSRPPVFMLRALRLDKVALWSQ